MRIYEKPEIEVLKFKVEAVLDSLSNKPKEGGDDSGEPGGQYSKGMTPSFEDEEGVTDWNNKVKWGD